jgi:hypothetical protein
MASIISAGTTSGTSLNLSGDTSGVLQLATNGSTTAITVDTSQNVGIGTASPSNLLHVSQASSDFQTRITGTSAANAGSIRTYNAGGEATGLGTTGSTNTGYGANLGFMGTITNIPQIFLTNNTERMRIDSSGNVGVGTTSSGNKFEVAGSGMFSGAVTTNTTGTHISYQSNNSQIGAWGPNTSTNGTLVFFSARSNGVNGLERMRIDSDGYVGIGNSSPGSVPARLVVSQGGNIAYFQQNAAGGYCGQFDATVNGGTYYFVNFLKAGVGISNITSNGTTISYNTGSDYRLKDNIQPITNALETVTKLKPSKWDWKEFWGGGSSQGFVAHELAEIIPDCVTGQKDAVDETGKPVYQGVDTSFLVATLTAAIQELKAELDATKAEVAALKGVN